MKNKCKPFLIIALIAAVFSVCSGLSGTAVYAATGEKQGTLQIMKLAEQSGNPLSGAVFGVYRASDNKRLADLTTDADGGAYHALEPGEYYIRELKPPYGYLLEQTQIHFTVMSGETVIVDVTNERDASISDNGTNGISIPKTGEDFPALNYIAGSVLIGIALLGGALLLVKTTTSYLQ
ncbi:MAG: prealbumin-like fold domain-containing protein [Clostridiales bacterium]|nr:prealbumin-like fold domain-containing protein [Clostridiales bacterium]